MGSFSDSLRLQNMTMADLHKEAVDTDKLILELKKLPKTRLLDTYILDAQEKLALIRQHLRKSIKIV